MRRMAIGGRRRVVASVLVLFLLVAGLFATRQGTAKAAVEVVKSSFQGKDGRTYTVTNHLVKLASTAGAPGAGSGHEYLLVWAGDKNVADTTGADIQGTHP